MTIVRLDTGEIIAHFGRAAQDVPKKIATGRVINSPFDSPVIGTPAIYPNAVGVTTQKIFVGDADGTIWRIDVSSPLVANWKVTLFQDLFNTGLPAPPVGVDPSQPIAIPMILSQDPSGNLVVNAATGDQENIVVTNEVNYVYSIQEQRPAAVGTPGSAIIVDQSTITGWLLVQIRCGRTPRPTLARRRRWRARLRRPSGETTPRGRRAGR